MRRRLGLSLAAGLSGCGGLPPAPPPLMGAAALRFAPGAPASAKYAALAPHHAHQETLSSCSVASAQTVLNALVAGRGRPPLSAADVLALDATGAWRRATADAQSPGLSLDQLALHLMGALNALGARHAAVDVVHVVADDPDSGARLEHVLAQGERQGDDFFVIANFIQSDATAEGDPVGHFSPLGAFDAARAAVLVLDVDPEVHSPYWVPLARLVTSMGRPTAITGEGRGYVVVRR